MGVISGQDMAISAGGTVESTGRAFRLFVTNEEAGFVASNTLGAEGHVAGNSDWTGIYMGYGHTPNVFPGDDFAFVGSLDGAAGISGTSAICERLTIRCPVEAGKPIEYEVRFGANSDLVLSGAAADATPVEAVSSRSLDVEFDAVALDHVRYWELEWYLKRPRRYFSSTTDGKARRTTSPLAGRWAVGFYTDDISAQQALIDTFTVGKFNVEAAKYWQMTYCVPKGIRELKADYEGEEPVSAELFGVLSATDGATVAAAMAIDPEGATRWPAP